VRVEWLLCRKHPGRAPENGRRAPRSDGEQRKSWGRGAVEEVWRDGEIRDWLVNSPLANCVPVPVISLRNGGVRSINAPKQHGRPADERSHSLRSPGQHKTVVRATPLQRCRLNCHAPAVPWVIIIQLTWFKDEPIMVFVRHGGILWRLYRKAKEIR